MIRIDTLWLCSQPQDMRAGADRLLNIVVNTVGAAHAHHCYIFANLRATRIKLLVHDGFGVWCATRRLHAGRFAWLLVDLAAYARPGEVPGAAEYVDGLVIVVPSRRVTVRRMKRLSAMIEPAKNLGAILIE